MVEFGLQGYLTTFTKVWDDLFFKRPFDEIEKEFLQEMEEYTLSKKFAQEIGTDHWRALHDLGYMPLEIYALPEGTRTPIRVPSFLVHATLDEFYWLPNFIETDVSCNLWGATTSATLSYEYRKIFTKWALKTGGDLSFIWFQGHDFSYRGMNGTDAALLSGAGHLLNFYGTDTIPAIKYLKKMYDADPTKEIIGCSVFATEHAVMCVSTGFYILKNGLTWEKYGEAEFEVFKRLITELYPTGIVSIVSDTWDLWKVLTEYLVKLKDEILARDGKLVIRPDSGDPVDIICGLNTNPNPCKSIEGLDSKPEVKGVVELLWDVFSGTVNEQGYKVLNPKIGCIYGDSITLDRADQICERLEAKGFASTNWVAGIGSFTYNYNTRDTFGFALKATAAEVMLNGNRHLIEIFKDPVTDDGTKKSARGLVMVIRNEQGELELRDRVTWEDVKSERNEMKLIWKNGTFIRKTTLHEIRAKLLTE